MVVTQNSGPVHFHVSGQAHSSSDTQPPISSPASFNDATSPTSLSAQDDYYPAPLAPEPEPPSSASSSEDHPIKATAAFKDDPPGYDQPTNPPASIPPHYTSPSPAARHRDFLQRHSALMREKSLALKRTLAKQQLKKVTFA